MTSVPQAAGPGFFCSTAGFFRSYGLLPTSGIWNLLLSFSWPAAQVRVRLYSVGGFFAPQGDTSATLDKLPSWDGDAEEFFQQNNNHSGSWRWSEHGGNPWDKGIQRYDIPTLDHDLAVTECSGSMRDLAPINYRTIFKIGITANQHDKWNLLIEQIN